MNDETPELISLPNTQFFLRGKLIFYRDELNFRERLCIPKALEQDPPPAPNPPPTPDSPPDPNSPSGPDTPTETDPPRRPNPPPGSERPPPATEESIRLANELPQPPEPVHLWGWFEHLDLVRLVP